RQGEKIRGRSMMARSPHLQATTTLILIGGPAKGHLNGWSMPLISQPRFLRPRSIGLTIREWASAESRRAGGFSRKKMDNGLLLRPPVSMGQQRTGTTE